MHRKIGAATAALLCAIAPAYAAPIVPGETLTGIDVSGHASIYEIFGHVGNPGGDYGADAPAILTTFSAAAGNIFTFSARGLVSCCSDGPNISPDGGSATMSVAGANGLSSLSGDHNIPLVGVFTSDTDPFGNPAPGALAFAGASAASISPLLNQVFYIGDGRAGYRDALGALLQFTAPTNATRLYLGVIDAFSFAGTTGYYADNNGSFTVDVSLTRTAAAVPEPASWAMLVIGFGLAGLAMRRQKAAMPALG